MHNHTSQPTAQPTGQPQRAAHSQPTAEALPAAAALPADPAASAASRRVPGRSRLAVVGVAALAALADWAILGPLAGISLEARQGGTQHIGAAAVVVSTVFVALAGWETPIQPATRWSVRALVGPGVNRMLVARVSDQAAPLSSMARCSSTTCSPS